MQNSTAEEMEAVRRQYQSAVAEMERQREEEERRQREDEEGEEEQAIEAVHDIIDQGQLRLSDLCVSRPNVHFLQISGVREANKEIDE